MFNDKNTNAETNIAMRATTLKRIEHATGEYRSES